MYLIIGLFFISITLNAGSRNYNLASVGLLKTGKQVYLQNCTACHGPKGDGQGPAAKAILTGPKPRDFTSGVYKYGSNPKDVFDTITKGSPGTAMPPWSQLTEKERWALAHYVLSLKKK